MHKQVKEIFQSKKYNAIIAPPIAIIFSRTSGNLYCRNPIYS